ncbi:OLC1v1021417C1 [Oldenlandia corymbosa var. corymbosa]|uniref:OLC1v1021417C1 n=1 Tax=Oldenlandia corymbosa var. corymbosa TaxID=529605 RepID=A0AAV1BVK9_OLDCO|nr:OLC1v1021417C1 [Oldenlandia corymbosa var. corymbosa]
MGKGTKSGACKSATHQLFKDRAKNRVDDLQGMFSDLQSARKDSRSNDVAVLEEQVHQMLREWKAELNEPSPASSLQAGSLGSFSSDINRLLQLYDVEDDATSALAAPKSEPDGQKADKAAGMQEGFVATQLPQEQSFQLPDESKNFPAVANNMHINNLGVAQQLDYHQFDLHQNFEQQYFNGFDVTGLCGDDLPHITGFGHNFYPPPAAFLGPKCALWDCPRPAQRAEWSQTSQDYCSNYHANIAPAEGCPGMPPVLRPGGIGLKDNLLFAALCAKSQGQEVGVPECEGAATAKSPWNAPELFDLSVLEGETIREWLFFDKPRRAFESGNRKQRALPDYTGRGWHESRKQVVSEYGGSKRSYYMDPQPSKNYEWHLYEYEISKYDACALYRLELKLVDGKKNSKGKVATDSVADLQKQMKKLNADFPTDKNLSVKDGDKAHLKNVTGNIYVAPDRLQLSREGFDYGTSASCDYLVDDGNVYYIT